MENKNFSYAIRMIIFLILICVLPISIAKIIKSFTKKDSNKITKNELNSEIKKYIENNAESVLETLLNKYFSLKKEEKSNFEINNAIWLFEKDLFNENLPRFPINLKEKDANSIKKEKPKVLIIFSDFDLVLPIFNEIFNFNPEKLEAEIFFRQIPTQSKYSTKLISIGITIFKLKPELFLPFYIDILSIPKQELEKEKIESIIKGLGLNLEEIEKEISKHKDEIDSQIKRTTTLTMDMGIKELPTFIFENGQIFFGRAGLEIIKNLYKKEK